MLALDGFGMFICLRYFQKVCLEMRQHAQIPEILRPWGPKEMLSCRLCSEGLDWSRLDIASVPVVIRVCWDILAGKIGTLW